MENTTAGKVGVQQEMREREDGVTEEEGKERSSHRLSIRVYHSSMQCGVWPPPSQNKAWKVIPFISRRTYENRGHLCACLPAVYYGIFLYFLFFLLILLYILFCLFFTVTILSKNMNILMDFLQSVCLVSCVCVCILCVLISASICLCVHTIYKGV